MIITPQLAQQIVEHIIPTVKYNINIMDKNGIIIATSYPHRLHSFHAGAKQAIDSNHVVEIYPDDLHRFPGALPGLNWPMLMGDQVVGVVGVSGHPDDVRETAHLVKMVTELILERESLREEFKTQTRLKEQFVSLLLSDQSLIKQPEIKKTAALLAYDLTLARFVAIIDMRAIFATAQSEYGTHGLVSSRTQETIYQLLENSAIITTNDLFVFLDNRLIILKQSTMPESPAEEIQMWGTQLHQFWENNLKLHLAIGIGSLATNYASLQTSYREALYASNLSASAKVPLTLYDYNVLSSYLIQRCFSAEDSAEALRTLTEKINSLSNKYDIRQTLTALLNNNLNLSATAKSLFIHRNTLLFRLERFKLLSGLDPCNNLNHAILCKIIFAQ